MNHKNDFSLSVSVTLWHNLIGCGHIEQCYILNLKFGFVDNLNQALRVFEQPKAIIQYHDHNKCSNARKFAPVSPLLAVFKVGMELHRR